jgi:hypothetical protein
MRNDSKHGIDRFTKSPAWRSRVLELEGGCNFRDLGGYRTRDGRELRWGRVFRSGVLSYFTPNHRQRLQQLGVRTICDLRRAEERTREQTHWPDSNTRHLTWDDGGAPPTIKSIASQQSHPYTAAGMHAATIDVLSRRFSLLWQPRFIHRVEVCPSDGSGLTDRPQARRICFTAHVNVREVVCDLRPIEVRAAQSDVSVRSQEVEARAVDMRTRQRTLVERIGRDRVGAHEIARNTRDLHRFRLSHDDEVEMSIVQLLEEILHRPVIAELELQPRKAIARLRSVLAKPGKRA